MMSRSSQADKLRSEAALRLACDALEGRAKKWPALESLQAFLKNKARLQCTKTTEQVLLKYLELCAELEQGQAAKDGLYHYKSACGQANPKSLEEVVKAYLKMAEGKARAAKEESEEQKRALDGPDVQTLALLSAVSGENAHHDRLDHALLAPRLRFLAEAYRHCLDLTHSGRMERLHHEVAQRAFGSCLLYARRTDFQNLCENLRFKAKQPPRPQPNQSAAAAVKPDNPESQEMLLQARLLQLDTAMSMELWPEVFKSAEDIQSLLAARPSAPRMADYYKRLSVAFWKCGDVLLHACALYRHYHLCVEMKKNLTLQERQGLATRVLLATLSVPVAPDRTDSFAHFLGADGVVERREKLVGLLGLRSPTRPTRQSLVADMVACDVPQYAAGEVKELYQWLEVETQPLKLSRGVVEVLSRLTAGGVELQQYVLHLQANAVVRLLQRAAPIYQSMELSQLASMLPFLSEFQLHRSIAEAARHCGDLQDLRIDQASRSVSFAPLPQDAAAPELFGNQLTALCASMAEAVRLIQPHSSSFSSSSAVPRTAEWESQRQQAVADYLSDGQKERERILAARRESSALVQRGTEEQDKVRQAEKEEEERLRREEKERQKALQAAAAKEEELRRLQEVREREAQRLQEQNMQIKRKTLRDALERMKKTELGARVFKDFDLESVDIEHFDESNLRAMQVQQLRRDERKRQKRLKAQWEKVHYLERAKHKEEIPLLENAQKEWLQRDRKAWDLRERERVERERALRQKNLKDMQSLSRAAVDARAFRSDLSESGLAQRQEDFAGRVAAERERLLEERKVRRKEERARAAREAREEQARRTEEERLRLERERHAEQDRRLREQAEKQSAREREIEERLRKEEEERSRTRRPSPPPAAPRPWRRGDRRSREERRESSPPAWRRGGAAGGTAAPARSSPSWRSGGEEDYRGSSSPRSRFDGDRRPGGWRDRVKEGQGEEDRLRERRHPHPPRDNDNRGGFWRRGGSTGTDDAERQGSWRHRDKRQLVNC